MLSKSGDTASAQVSVQVCFNHGHSTSIHGQINSLTLQTSDHTSSHSRVHEYERKLRHQKSLTVKINKRVKITVK